MVSNDNSMSNVLFPSKYTTNTDKSKIQIKDKKQHNKEIENSIAFGVITGGVVHGAVGASILVKKLHQKWKDSKLSDSEKTTAKLAKATLKLEKANAHLDYAKGLEGLSTGSGSRVQNKTEENLINHRNNKMETHQKEAVKLLKEASKLGNAKAKETLKELNLTLSQPKLEKAEDLLGKLTENRRIRELSTDLKIINKLNKEIQSQEKEAIKLLQEAMQLGNSKAAETFFSYVSNELDKSSQSAEMINIVKQNDIKQHKLINLLNDSLEKIPKEERTSLLKKIPSETKGNLLKILDRIDASYRNQQKKKPGELYRLQGAKVAWTYLELKNSMTEKELDQFGVL